MISENNLPAWDKFCKLAKGNNSKSLIQKLFGNSKHRIGDVTRLNARYRLAKEIKAIEFETFEQRTAEGYTALMKTFLACNALEMYTKLIGLKSMLEVSESIYSKEEIDNLIKQIGILDKKKLFVGYIAENSNNLRLKQILSDYVNGNTYLAFPHFFIPA
jgi:hypothetical protein